MINNFTRNKGKNPACPQCHGEGNYMYDDNHGTVCNLCCAHDVGWWKLSEKHYEKEGGKYACCGGCGTVKKTLEAGEMEVEKDEKN